MKDHPSLVIGLLTLCALTQKTFTQDRMKLIIQEMLQKVTTSPGYNLLCEYSEIPKLEGEGEEKS